MKSRVAIVILNWRYYHTTIECLKNLKPFVNPNITVIIVENGSDNESSSEITKYLNTNYRDINFQFIESATNTGFSGGVNLSVTACLKFAPDYIFLLNSDAKIELQTIQSLIETSKANGDALVGPAMYNSPNHSSPYFFGSKWPYSLFGIERTPSTSPNNLVKSGYIEGSALLIPVNYLKKRLEKFGYLLDPNLFLYCEDLDLGRHAISEGFSCLVDLKAKSYHEISNSGGGRGNPLAYYYITRNRILIAQRWLSPHMKMMFHLYYLPSRLILLALRALRVGPDLNIIKSILYGLYDGYIGHWGQWKHHDKITSSKVY